MTDKPYEITEVLGKQYFERLIRQTILELYKEDIKNNYEVFGYAQLQTGDYVVILRRTVKSFSEQVAP